MALLHGLFAGDTLNALFGFGEEAGWRGYLLHEWKHMQFWKASLFIGLIWGIWHAPLILLGYNYPQHSPTGSTDDDRLVHIINSGFYLHYLEGKIGYCCCRDAWNIECFGWHTHHGN